MTEINFDVEAFINETIQNMVGKKDCHQQSFNAEVLKSIVLLKLAQAVENVAEAIVQHKQPAYRGNQ